MPLLLQPIGRLNCCMTGLPILAAHFTARKLAIQIYLGRYQSVEPHMDIQGTVGTQTTSTPKLKAKPWPAS